MENTRVNACNKRNNSSSVMRFATQDNQKMLNLYKNICENPKKKVETPKPEKNGLIHMRES